MFERFDSHPPPGVCLLLRTDAEQRWLSREVFPTLRELEARERLAEDQLGAALAYMEVVWSEAMLRAGETEAAQSQFAADCQDDPALSSKARSYHATVRARRKILAARVARVMAASSNVATRAHVSTFFADVPTSSS